MLSKEAERELLEGARSESLRKDMETMRRNVLAHRLSVEALLEFLTAMSRCFGPSKSAPPIHYRRALI